MGLFTVDNKHKPTVREALAHNTRAAAKKALSSQCEQCGKHVRTGNQYCSPKCTKKAAASW